MKGKGMGVIKLPWKGRKFEKSPAVSEPVRKGKMCAAVTRFETCLVVFVVNCVWRPPTACAWACVCLWTRAKNLLRHIKDKSFRIGLGICNHERPQTLLTERRGIGKKSETLVPVSELADKQLGQTSVSYTAEMPGPNTVLITGSNDLNCARVQ